jgi:signal transduction histidine kinase
MPAAMQSLVNPMKKIFALILQRFKSVTVQLWLIFIAFTFALSVIFSFSFGKAMQRNFENVLAPHMVQYMRFTLRDIGTPPSLDRAEAIGKNLPLTLWIMGPDDLFWASSGAEQRDYQAFLKHLDYYDDHYYKRDFFQSSLSQDFESSIEQWIKTDRPHGGNKKGFEKGKYRPHKSHPIPRSWQRKLGRQAWMVRGEDGIIFGIKKGKYRYFFEFDINHRDWEEAASMLLFGTLFLLTLLFLLLRWLFKPIQEISTGVKEFAQGNLAYRIPLRKRNELSELANNTNVMAERLRAYIDSKRVLLLGMSHELRTPITRSKLTLEFLPDGDEKENLQQDLAEMTAIIEELLAAERAGDSVEGNQQHLTTVNMKALVSSTLAQMSALDKVIQEVADSYIQADEVRLKLLLRNLISNALRHNRDELGQVVAAVQQTEDTFVLSVKDYGLGIAKADVEKVTEPFYRADSARTRGQGGVGLGLYLCKVIAEAHGAELVIDSEENVGTTVSFILTKR